MRLAQADIGMSIREIILQVCQVLTVLGLAPLLQGAILQFEERVQRAQGPGIFQPYRDLWKLFHKQIIVPETASWVYWVAPFVAFTAMLTVPILIPVLTDFPLPLSDMGDILGGGLILTLGSFMIVLAGLDTGSAYGGIGSSRAVMVAILAEPTLILVFVGITLLAKAMLPFVVNHLLVGNLSGVLESSTPVPHRRIFHTAHRGDRSPSYSFQYAHRSLHDRRGADSRIFGSLARAVEVGIDDEAVHSLHDIQQRAVDSVGAVA